MIRHATFTVDEIFNTMDLRSLNAMALRKDLRDLKLTSDRLVLFKTKGANCVSCPLVGTYFALESVKVETPHLNLYGLDSEGQEVLMTKDHIFPKSKGGANHLDNYQPMCANCNREKADKFDGA